MKKAALVLFALATLVVVDATPADARSCATLTPTLPTLYRFRATLRSTGAADFGENWRFTDVVEDGSDTPGADVTVSVMRNDPKSGKGFSEGVEIERRIGQRYFVAAWSGGDRLSVSGCAGAIVLLDPSTFVDPADTSATSSEASGSGSSKGLIWTAVGVVCAGAGVALHLRRRRQEESSSLQ